MNNPSKHEPFQEGLSGEQGEEVIMEDNNLADHLSLVESRSGSRATPRTPRPPVIINPVLARLIEEDRENPMPIDVQEVN